MAWGTPKTNWSIIDGIADADLNRMEENTRILSQQSGAYGTTTNIGNAFSVTASPPITSLVDGLYVAIKVNANNTGAATLAVNGLAAATIKKANGNDLASGNLKAGIIYSLRYNSTTGNFILQGEGGGGTATAAHVLAGDTFTNDAGSDQVGTMPNMPGANTAASASLQNGGVVLFTLAKGAFITDNPSYGAPTVSATDTDLTENNIRANINVLGKNGTFTADGNVSPGVMITGYRGYANGAAIDGSMANQPAVSTPASIASMAGAIYARLHHGAYITNTGTGWPELLLSDGNFIANNIVQGVPIYGLTGSRRPWNNEKKWASGSGTLDTTAAGVVVRDGSSYTIINKYRLQVGLSFDPSFVIFHTNSTSYGNNHITIATRLSLPMSGTSGWEGIMINVDNGITEYFHTQANNTSLSGCFIQPCGGNSGQTIPYWFAVE